MKNLKITYADILSAIVFVPESSILVINMIRKFLKKTFRLIGEIATIFL
ncbi:MAG: hypothetical protein JXR51_08250 [Bacteroidales bacterium]|nr:hypothetical protein [Bacteroidales bacterium]MBN2757152.1 hypothetical protein [Bacteroidales bacterium]